MTKEALQQELKTIKSNIEAIEKELNAMNTDAEYSKDYLLDAMRFAFCQGVVKANEHWESQEIYIDESCDVSSYGSDFDVDISFRKSIELNEECQGIEETIDDTDLESIHNEWWKKHEPVLKLEVDKVDTV